MSHNKPYYTRKTSALIALLVSTTTITPFFSLFPAAAQLFPRPSNSVFNSNRVVIPAGTQIPVQYDEAEKILVTREETMPLTLKVAANLKNRNGTILIPYGSEIVGQIEPSGNGSRFVAQKLVIKRCDSAPLTGARECAPESEQQSLEYSLDATSEVVTRTETVKEGASAGDILKGAAIGAAASSVIAAIIGDKAIATEEVLGGAGLGALAGWILGGDSAELISIDPDRDLTLTLHSDLNRTDAR